MEKVSTNHDEYVVECIITCARDNDRTRRVVRWYSQSTAYIARESPHPNQKQFGKCNESQKNTKYGISLQCVGNQKKRKKSQMTAKQSL